MSADIDIDVADRDRVLNLIKHVAARQSVNDSAKKHISGIYVTDIPYDPVLNCSAIDYEEAEQRGYFKIDLLHMSVYKLVKDETHYQQMLSCAPQWHKLWQNSSWASQLIHIGRYTDLLASMRPDSIPKMAAFISVIRPGKAHLQKQPWSVVFESVWDGDTSKGYTFKKSHAISYAALVALHMNLLDSSDQSN